MFICKSFFFKSARPEFVLLTCTPGKQTCPSSWQMDDKCPTTSPLSSGQCGPRIVRSDWLVINVDTNLPPVQTDRHDYKWPQWFAFSGGHKLTLPRWSKPTYRVGINTSIEWLLSSTDLTRHTASYQMLTNLQERVLRKHNYFQPLPLKSTTFSRHSTARLGSTVQLGLPINPGCNLNPRQPSCGPEKPVWRDIKSNIWQVVFLELAVHHVQTAMWSWTNRHVLCIWAFHDPNSVQHSRRSTIKINILPNNKLKK